MEHFCCCKKREYSVLHVWKIETVYTERFLSSERMGARHGSTSHCTTVDKTLANHVYTDIRVYCTLYSMLEQAMGTLHASCGNTTRQLLENISLRENCKAALGTLQDGGGNTTRRLLGTTKSKRLAEGI